MNKNIVLWVVLVALIIILGMQDAMASSSQEDQVIGIIERVLDVLANFLSKVFNSIADAVKSIFNGS